MVVGIFMTVTGPTYPFKPVHTHFNLLGWMSMMIYGVGYHILPRFSGNPLWSDKMSYVHLWLANIGLIGMACGWVILSKGGSYGILHGFAMVEGISILLFALNMFLTIKAVPTPVKPKPAQ